MKTLKQAHGNWVDGDRFWDREKEIEIFVDALEEGAHLHLVAQRRIGKTSLMREVSRRIEGRYVCLHVDLQKARRAEDLIVELSMATHRHKPLWEKTREVFGNALKAISQVVESVGIDEVNLKIREGLHPTNWQSKGGRLLAALAECDQGVVVFMDEVPILVNRILKGADYKIDSRSYRGRRPSDVLAQGSEHPPSGQDPFCRDGLDRFCADPPAGGVVRHDQQF